VPKALFLQNPTNNSDMKKVENQVAAYVKTKQEDVYYAVTPLYDGNSEAPYGVRMEAVSVNGDGLDIDVTIIETQPTQPNDEEQPNDGKCP